MIRDMIEMEIELWGRVGHPALLQRFILRNGREYRPVKTAIADEPKHCFQNAAFRSGGDMRYVEGYGLPRSIPLLAHHAWNSPAGIETAIDTTWRDPLNCSYWGVAFPKEIVRRELALNGHFGLLADGGGMLNLRLMLETDPGLAEFMPAGLACAYG